MKAVLLTCSAGREKDLRKRNTKIALVLCLAVLGTAIRARAQCRDVHGSITSTAIPAPNDPHGRALGIVLGVLNGSSTAIATNVDTSAYPVLKATSFDVFVTNRGDMLTAVGASTLTPVPSKPLGEFTVNVTLTITGGSGEYVGATGMITLEGKAQNFFGGPGVATFNEVYQGSVCGPNLKTYED